ncbi:aldose 1-epimerase family protein [Bacteroides sp. ET225]|uniref:aldose 1-epimerase family protein n=1 Tax=Bacteroides sp. ET225 TaxID=2972461 RepID=UPI0021AC13E0|nr:aldose 1-epimerase family protein [Bacteroides sp. ET225]MCR8918445.1 aldose 1-epimerase family protein [Bacteroides sp. ET225]
MKTLSNSHLTIRVSPHGAELCSIMRGGKEYLWQADPAFWKRHSPVLFPIVGSVWNNTYYVNDKPFGLSQHGFARDMDFEPVLETADEVRFRLASNGETLAKYPFPFVLEIGYRLEGNAVRVMWQVTNPSDEEIHFQIGAHPAFYYPAFNPAESRRGFFGFGGKRRLEYLLIAEKGCVDIEKRNHLELGGEGLLPIDTHTFDHDALIIEDDQVKEVTLYDLDKRPYITLRFDAPVVGLWSPPGKNAPFVCIEPWYGRCDRMCYVSEFKDKDWMQHLQAHGVFRAEYLIEVR